jgi:hypothetical protein
VWTGAKVGDWGEARNWSRHAVPTRSSRACIPRGTVVVVSGERHLVRAVEAGGGIVIVRGGALLLMGSDVASEVGELGLAHGVLGGPGKLLVTQRMYWGKAGQILGVGDITLGSASHSRIETGVDGEEGVLGGDDGTGPGFFDSKHAPSPPCGPYSPRWAEACATGHPADDRAIRSTWVRFAAAVNAGADRVDGLATRSVVARAAKARPLATTLRDLLVEGNRAIARLPGSAPDLRFARLRGVWRIRSVRPR